ncbi:inorganic diphosphatase [Moniliophthora roreri]|nr:inorganic diphosphatase [Moniliophthora roreri]
MSDKGKSMNGFATHRACWQRRFGEGRILTLGASGGIGGQMSELERESLYSGICRVSTHIVQPESNLFAYPSSSYRIHQ